MLDLNEHGVLSWVAEVVANRGTNQEAANVVGARLVELYRVMISSKATVQMTAIHR